MGASALQSEVETTHTREQHLGQHSHVLSQHWVMEPFEQLRVTRHRTYSSQAFLGFTFQVLHGALGLLRGSRDGIGSVSGLTVTSQ